ncbi:MAG TPA: PRC-barrel domain-containing protein [Candidatus Angelobacter sp.]|nr:PRC-barrel domain-containing protein [Candidatus Angelobacter sp.]
MFHTLHELHDDRVVATDGRIGRIHNILFDDRSWKIRYFVVDLKDWLTRREVVIAANVADQPDWRRKLLPVRITKEEVRHSPDVDSAKPVARQQEIAFKEHYGWPLTWGHIRGEVFIPPAPTGCEYPVPSEEDRHLRSANHLYGYELHKKSQVIGRLENFVLDSNSWSISYLEIRAGDWLYRQSFLIATTNVESLSWARHQVNLRPE